MPISYGKQFFVTVAQGGDSVSMFAEDAAFLCKRVTDLLDRWSARRIISGRLVGPVPLDVETVHVTDEWTDGDFAATDFVPQAALSDFDGSATSGEA